MDLHGHQSWFVQFSKMVYTGPHLQVHETLTINGLIQFLKHKELLPRDTESTMSHK